jgi:hypothetical protein
VSRILSGWFTEYYFELQTWAETPSWFKPWSDHEMSTATIRAWSPLTVHGLLQTEDYARAVNSVEPRVTTEQVAERTASRMTFSTETWETFTASLR